MEKSHTSQAQENQAQQAPDQGVWGTDHTLFLGEYSHKVDDKGRLALPAKFRAGLSDGAVLTRGADQSLYLYSVEQWKPQAEKLAALPAWSSPEARELQRTVLGGATAVTPDKQGRILLPGNLREYAGLDSTSASGGASEKTTEVVVAGLYGRIEIHLADRWKAARKATDLEKIAPKLADLGI